MGRRRASNFDDPPRFHRKGTVWYHVSGTSPRLWTKLSSDRAEALRLWAQREGVREDESTKLFSVVARRYVREVYPTKSIQTRLDNDKELANLSKVFAHMPIDAIEPMHIRQYMDIRGQVAKVRANREKALFSHLFNKAREWGYTATQNPCQGVKGFKESGRSRYITDVEFDQVKAQAHITVVDAMDLALLTGQRPADVLKLKRTDIRDGALWIVQNKTGARLGIEITGELAATIARINERPRLAISDYLIQDENGQPLTQCALRSRFDKARMLAKVDFQFRDIRAKAATDIGDLAHAQKLLAHKNRDMTEHYVRSRMGDRVKPVR
ncbi:MULTISPECIES: tyrosine-type recombinase/integrase [unclassified Polaromonas]|uniref:tyrosine-type recombinase/integrase n=1 Tax=unclassified Polaromonas TaxID=2638319 RepID=UPI001A243610|nr:MULTISPECIES: tyrosine-type recombinase/integrase [unclassified Polaromonas]MBG6074013.1 integrase [Polaromonas sp. CG_9.7]MBG6116029.1 integrase [Polaromonas sp. CG_9.2]